MKTILVIDDEPSVRESFRVILGESYRVATAESGKAGMHALDETHVDLVLVDLMMPGMSGLEVLDAVVQRDPSLPVVVVTAINSVSTAVDAMKRGAREYVIKPFDVDEILLIVQRALAEQQNRNEIHAMREANKRGFESLIGDSPALMEAISLAQRAAKVESTVLVTGESGTGKELIARAIHATGPRAKEAFVPVPCCAIPESLFESDVFGHERGAFTGAYEKRIGKVQLADRGTLFLDELGEMPLDSQAKLLRVLQEGQLYPVGSAKMIDVDVRVICATNRNLEECVAQRTFRQDLFYRINVIPIEMPPLRKRRQDIPLLVEHFVAKHAPRVNAAVKRFSGSALARMSSYDWPGNVRELENAVERLLVHHNGVTAIDEGHLAQIAPASTREKRNGGLSELEGLPLEEATERVERHLILQALARENNIQSRAAARLGTTRRILKYKMDQLGIESLEANGV